MKLDEMKVQYDKSRDGFSSESDFTVQTEPKVVRSDASGIVVKIGLCVGVLILAFIVRAIGMGRSMESVVAASTNSDTSGTSAAGEPSLDRVGSLHYVDAGTVTKWSAPVVTNDIELLRDGQLLRFTATNSDVKACLNGKVLSVGEEEPFGKCVRIQAEGDLETLYFGFAQIAIEEGQQIEAGQVLGTIEVGRSIYMKVLDRGEPQDPTAYIDLSINRE